MKLLAEDFATELKDNGFEDDSHSLVRYYSGNDDVALIRDTQGRGLVIFDCHSAHGMWEPQRFNTFNDAVEEFELIVEDLQEMDIDNGRTPGKVSNYEE